MEPSRRVTSASTRAPFAAPRRSERASSWRRCGGRVKASTCALVTHALAAGAGVCRRALSEKGGGLLPGRTGVRSRAPDLPVGGAFLALAGGRPRQGHPRPFSAALSRSGACLAQREGRGRERRPSNRQQFRFACLSPASRIAPSRSAIAASSQIRRSPRSVGSAS
jgi:hypothetical protein